MNSKYYVTGIPQHILKAQRCKNRLKYQNFEIVISRFPNMHIYQIEHEEFKNNATGISGCILRIASTWAIILCPEALIISPGTHDTCFSDFWWSREDYCHIKKRTQHTKKNRTRGYLTQVFLRVEFHIFCLYIKFLNKFFFYKHFNRPRCPN